MSRHAVHHAGTAGRCCWSARSSAGCSPPSPSPSAPSPFPMLLDEKIDAFTAMGTSISLVWNNLPVMITWGAIVLALFLAQPRDRAARADRRVPAARPRDLARLQGDQVSCCAPGARGRRRAGRGRRRARRLLLASRDHRRRPPPDRSFGAGHSLRDLHPAIESGLSAPAGVEQARVNLSTKRVSVKWRDGEAAAD